MDASGAKIVLSNIWRYDRNAPEYNGDFLEFREAETIYADLEQAFRKEIECVGAAEETTDEKMEAITKYLIEKYKDAWIELAKGLDG